MQLRYGTYSWDANALTIATFSELQYNEAEQPKSVKVRAEVEGYLTALGQAALTALEIQMIQVMRGPSRDLIFYQDDNSPSAIRLTNVGSISGVLITKGPDFARTNGPEYATERKFSFTAEAEYPILGQNILVSFNETLTFSGGGPVYGHLPACKGLPQKQLLQEFSVFKVIQSGAAVGYNGYPFIPPPIWPAALRVNGTFSLTSPKRRGQGYTDYAKTWQYEFESATPLAGFPTLWRG